MALEKTIYFMQCFDDLNVAGSFVEHRSRPPPIEFGGGYGPTWKINTSMSFVY